MTDKIDTSADLVARLRDHGQHDGEEMNHTWRRFRVERLEAADAIDALRAEVERLQYVLGGVASAIDTGRNEPLVVWREQIDIALSPLKGASPPAKPAQLTVREYTRETVVETITEIIGETHDIDVQDHHYAEAIVRWLEQNHPAAFRAIEALKGRDA